jgi:hypothetical protein
MVRERRYCGVFGNPVDILNRLIDLNPGLFRRIVDLRDCPLGTVEVDLF